MKLVLISCIAAASVASSTFAQIIPAIRMRGPGDSQTCVQVGGDVFFDVFIDNPQFTVVAGQFSVNYDNTVLDFVEVLPGAAPFVSVPLSMPNESAGQLFWLSSVAAGGTGTAADSRIATLKFRALTEDCNDDVQVSFDIASTPILIANGDGFAGTLPLSNPAAVSIDSTPPVISNVPANLDVPADAGAGCMAMRMLTEPTATDSCGPVVQSWTRSDGATDLNAPWMCGLTTVTWSAVNRCGLTSTATTTVMVQSYHLLEMNVEYAGLSSVYAPSMTRCIGVRAGNFNFTQVLEFGYGDAFATAQIPIGSYNCATVDDDLHSLVSQTDVVIVGTNYSLSATGASALVNGDLNDDNTINVIDWGIVVVRIGSAAAVNTDCSTTGFQPDFDGSGTVTDVDGQFVLSSFLANGDSFCGSAGILAANISKISVADLSKIMGENAAAADINRDGVVDLRDMRLWNSGKRTAVSSKK
jgi:hypothetical protein